MGKIVSRNIDLENIKDCEKQIVLLCYKRGSIMGKVLIVEDDLILRSAYTTVLTMEGFEVRGAQDGLEGLQMAKDDEPDVILLDMLMPKLSGTEFLKKYNLLKNHPNVKVIVFSNTAVPEQMSEVMELGAARYLTKSEFTPKEMVTTIRGYCMK